MTSNSGIGERVSGYWRSLRAHPAFNREAALERVRERDGHEVDADHHPHLAAAVDWLVRAQDVTADAGIARGYSLCFHPYWRSAGWQPSYPETTGYIIPTLLQAARHLGRPELVQRALDAARWESSVQLPSGAVQGGVIGQGSAPAVFNTGQVILGWLAAHEVTGDRVYSDSTRRAAGFLLDALGSDGHWRNGNSTFARRDATLYNARVGWALAEAGARLSEPRYRDSAARNLHAVRRRQAVNGWFPDCCLTDSGRPLLHTIAYTIRGLIEGGRVLEDPALVRAGAQAALALRESVRPDGWMAGRFHPDWTPAVEWSCLTGVAQMACTWIRLYHVSGDPDWLEPVPRVLRFLKRTQNRVTAVAGLRGGIKGSCPVDGEYGRYEVLNWPTKFFADALMLHDGVALDAPPAGSGREFVLG